MKLHKIKINGRRGGFQMLLGIIYFLLGISQIIMDPERSSSFDWLRHLVPQLVIGAPWVITGSIAIFSSFLPRPKDWLSFALLTAMPTAMGSLFLISYFVNDTDNIIGSLVYWAMAGMVMVVSGMQGPTDKDIRKVEL